MSWTPFDLHPEYPPEGISRGDLHARYGPDMPARVRTMIDNEGLPYSPPDVVPNSMKALKLAELARDFNLYEDVHRALFDAYWAKGEDIGDYEVLEGIGVAAGLDPERIEWALSSGAYSDRIRNATETAVSIGVSGVPAWVIDHRMLIVGAHPPAVFERILTELGFAPLRPE